MIRFAVEKDRMDVQQMWKEAFSGASSLYAEYYLKELMNLGHVIVSDDGQKIHAMMELRPHTMALGGKRILAFMLEGIADAEALRDSSAMDELMEKTLDLCSRKALVTLIQESRPGMYARYGFSPRYYCRQYTFRSTDIPRYEDSAVRAFASPEDMSRLYRRFLKKFQGYYLDEGRFQRLVRQMQYEHGTIFSCYEKDHLSGYYLCYDSAGTRYVDEIVYESGKALATMLAHATDTHDTAVVRVSGAERLEKIVKNARCEVIEDTLVRVNNEDLFRKCYQISDGGSVKEVFSSKPLYLKESQ